MKEAIKKLWVNAKGKIVLGSVVIAGLAALLTNTKLIIDIFKPGSVELVDVSFFKNDSLVIKLKNTGKEAAILKKFKVAIKKKWLLEPNDYEKGVLLSSATYNLSIDGEKMPPYDLSCDISQVTESGKTDRFLVQIGSKFYFF